MHFVGLVMATSRKSEFLKKKFQMDLRHDRLTYGRYIVKSFFLNVFLKFGLTKFCYWVNEVASN